MKKQFLLLAVSLMILGGASAQKAYWGVKAELNLSTFVGSDATGSNHKIGYGVGVLGNFPINQVISLAPELKYLNIGAKGEVNNTETTLNYNYIALPIMLRCYFNKTVALEVGPQFALLATAKADINNVSVDITDQFERFDASLGAGLLLEFDRVFFTGRYNYSLTQFLKDQNAFHAVAAFGFGIKF